MNSKDLKGTIRCLLCKSDQHEFFFKDKLREYRRCTECSLLFVPRQFHVSPESEKARYDQHNNDPDDIRYHQFLERIAEPIKKHFKKGARGLDFGCGPTPLLAEILKSDGFIMEVYDPFYASDKSVLDGDFDFIAATEVIEHLNNPLEELRKLFSIIKKGGILVVMTRLYDDSIDFAGWHYKNDRTHVGFYSLETFGWLGRTLSVTCSQIESDIFVLKTGEETPENRETHIL